MENNQNIPSKVREIKVSYSHPMKASLLPKITTSKEVYDHLIKFWNEEAIEYVEEFKIILLNRAHRILGICDVSRGGISGTIVDPKVIFSCALKANASYIILAHNHPSGNLNPSEADKQLTEKLKMAGKFLDLYILDHLIITNENYYSFADDGLL